MPDPTPPPAPNPDPPRPDTTDWERIEREPRFRALVETKRRFILPATVFFIVYYFALPVLVGYFPEAMGRDVIGEITIAYLFALSQFAMAWILMAMYVKRAKTFDAMEHEVVAEHGRGGDA